MCDEADRLAAGAGAAVRTRIGINRYWACDIDADTVVTWSLIERLGSLAAQSGEKMLALQVLKCRLHTTLEGGDLEAADDVAARFAASAAEVGSADMLRLDRLYAAMRAGSRGSTTWHRSWQSSRADCWPRPGGPYTLRWSTVWSACPGKRWSATIGRPR